MSSPAFTVVVPLYNKAQYIERALRSVFGQTVQDFEVVVINDGSTDDGPQIVENHAWPRLRLVHQTNSGVSVARNRGIAEARAKLVAFLDADDEWHPEYLETIGDLARLFPAAGFYGTAHQTVAVDGMAAGERPATAALDARLIRNFFKATIDRELKLQISTVCIPRRVLDELGGFLAGERLGEDLELLCRIAVRYPLAYSSRTGGLYYRNVSNSAVSANMLVEDMPFAKTARKAIESGIVPAQMIPDIREYVAEEQLCYIRTQVLCGNRLFASRLLKRCDTSRYRMRKMWWSFWARVPTPGTQLAFQVKSKIRGILTGA